MGKGDKKTKRGKIIMGSYGVRRPKRHKISVTAESKSEVAKVKEEKKAKEEVQKEKKKVTPKKVATEAKEEVAVETPKKKSSRKIVDKETESKEE